MANFHLVIPNICQDGHHNCEPQGRRILRFNDFLAREIPLIQRWAQTFGSGNLAVIITYDQGITKSPNYGDRFGNGGNVAFAVLGPPVKDRVYPTVCDHYRVLRTLEDGFGVSIYLNNAALANPIINIWGP